MSSGVFNVLNNPEHQTCKSVRKKMRMRMNKNMFVVTTVMIIVTTVVFDP